MGKIKSAKGKSKKITWKKIKHPEFEDFLDQRRQEERLGISEKTNEDLFFVDQLGFDDDFSELQRKKKEVENKRVTRSKSGPLVNLDDLKCFQILKPHSNVKDPVIKRNPIKKGGQYKTLDMKLKDEIRYFKQAREKEQKDSERKIVPVSGDLWDGQANANEVKQTEILSNEWLTDNTKRNLLRNRTTHQPKRKTTELKPVETPHPGLSYNPSFKDHQDILHKAVEMEKANIKAQQKIERATFIPRDNVNTKPEILEVKSEPESDSEDEKDVKPKIAFTKPKTKSQKRREKEQKLKEMQIQNKKKKSKIESEVYRVKTLKKQIDAKDKKNKLRLEKRVEKKVLRERFGVKTLSRYRFEEPKPQPVLSEDLSKGLVSTGGVNTIGDLLLDRFKSLQKRNVIEPRVKQTQKRKNKLKKYVRDSDKMEWEKTGVWDGLKVEVASGRQRRTRNKQARK